jgi:hypothetical protein
LHLAVHLLGRDVAFIDDFRFGRSGPNAAFLQGLAQFGWTDGGNVRIETRWAAGDADRIRRFVAEVVTLAPDVIVTCGSANVGPYTGCAGGEYRLGDPAD